MLMWLIPVLLFALFEVGFIVFAQRREKAEQRYQRLMTEIRGTAEDPPASRQVLGS